MHLKEEKEEEENAMPGIIQQQPQRKKLKQLMSVLNFVILVYALYLVLNLYHTLRNL